MLMQNVKAIHEQHQYEQSVDSDRQSEVTKAKQKAQIL